MKIFQRIVLILFYFCLSFCVIPCAACTYDEALLNSYTISEAKTDITAIKKLENYYIISPNTSEILFFESSDKNNDFGLSINDKGLINNGLRYFLFCRNTYKYNYLSHNSVFNLKNTLNIRAP